jgi:putative hemolysin
MNRSNPSSSVSATAGGYRLRLAENPADVRAAQVLRFTVFNLELREGLESAYDTCLDQDRFDEVCDHLLIECVDTGTVIGTYRMQTGPRAGGALGYYSEQEFDFSVYETLRPEIVELGRACIHADHRSFAVLNLLWKGIARYAALHGGRYLIGCSSLTSQDPTVALAASRDLETHWVAPALRTVPRPAYACPDVEPQSSAVKIPRLLRAYLSVGARICGPPALDREFKTIDFLTLLDLRSLPTRALGHFFG